IPLEISNLGELIGIRGVCFSQRLPDWITKDIIRSCEDTLAPIADVEFDIQRTDGDSRGAGIVLVAEFENGMLGSNALTSRGHTAEKAGEDAANDLLREITSGATMDVHTADQLLPNSVFCSADMNICSSNSSPTLIPYSTIASAWSSKTLSSPIVALKRFG
ncbi:MAG: hypothetical protein J6C90_02415, partial [Clostridia bacterium]|nr:hypothetical protein [Clostridia bacterium]